MKFDFQSDIPLFQQVANQLEEEIFHEVYKEGDQVPSTTEISTGYQINPATVLKGMNLLVSEQVLGKKKRPWNVCSRRGKKNYSKQKAK